MKDIDYQVLKLIPSSEKRITTREISKLLRISERQVFSSTERLKKAGVPIVSERIGNKGMFIARTEEERQIGLTSFRSQIRAMEERLKQVENARLETWNYDLKDPQWRKRATGTQRVKLNGKEFTLNFELSGDDTTKGYATIPDEFFVEIEKMKNKDGRVVNG
ncbi:MULTISPECIES: helix-turn-helix domain-containing protein [Enterococcus]|uniref:hypothetical protein n=1 Tax=Enterococcus TaxID=1350 RepID=UPI0010F6E549|nr:MULTISPECIES: hypothetical protein [Enterococcus]MBM7712439.1 DNA-binding Lrp family transcriptional regulator [Enterococcus xiangfangensis]